VTEALQIAATLLGAVYSGIMAWEHRQAPVKLAINVAATAFLICVAGYRILH
jgi:hypothetical protein